MKQQLAVLVLLVTVLSGCASKIPPLQEILPEPLPMASAPSWKVADYKLLSKQVFPVGQYTEMQQYIAQVLNSNPDLKSIAATAKAASYSVKIARTEKLPRVNLNLSRTRNRDASKEVGNMVSVGADVNWALDIWGKLSDDAAEAEHLSDKSQHELQQLKRVLIGQSARSWIEYRGYVHAEKYFIRLNKAQVDLLDYYQDAYQIGLAPYEFFLDAKNSLKRSQSRQQEIQLEKLKALQFMNTLRGRFPADELRVSDDNIPLTLVAFTEEIPATVLVNRPDIQAAFSEVGAFIRSERSARKALLPQINLTASASKSGLNLAKALRGDLVWELIGGLTQPLFNGGQLRAIAKQRSAEAEASWWQYQNTVLKAMLEVENAMVGDQFWAWQLEQKRTEVNNLEQKISAAEERFSDGDLPLADYLQIKIERIEAQIELNEVEVSYIKNRLSLVTALGLPMEILQDINNEKS